MRIRHVVAVDNVNCDDGTVRDPLQVRHGIIVGAKVAGLTSPIDPLTHLNLDFAAHRADRCLVVTACETGAPIVLSADGFVFAHVRPQAYRRLGKVDTEAARLAWQRHFATRHSEGDHVHAST